MLMKPFVVYGSDMWAMTEMDMKRPSPWEKKILRRIHRPVVEQEMWRIRTNRKLRELCQDLDTV